MKKGKSSQSRDDHKEKPKPNTKDKENSHNHPQSAIGEIKMITRGLSTNGSFRSLKKSQQRQVNSVHKAPPLKQRTMSMDILFSKEYARGMKQPHDNPLVIMLMIEGFNTR